MPFVIYDVETSGTSTAFDQILQLAALYLDDELPLTPTEFRILEVLLRQTGRAFTRYELMDAALHDLRATLPDIRRIEVATEAGRA